MKMLKLFKNQSGVTLIESMVAISILSVISLTVATLLKDAGEGVKTNEAKSETTGLKNILLSNFTDTNACTYTFSPYITQANLTAATGSGLVTIAFVKDKLNNQTYSTASTNVRPLTITGIYLTNYSSAGGTADLLVKTTFQKSSTKVVNLKDIRVPINMNITGTAAAPVLSGCSTMAVGDDWMLAGNAGTVDGTDYIGTSDNVPLNFRVNAQKAGRIDHTVGQTFFGYQAGQNQIATNDGTAFGYQASGSNTSGINNSSFGWVALRANTTGAENSAFGNRSMQSNITGGSNAAFGASSLTNNSTGNGNSALGWGSLFTNTTGNYNTAIGVSSLMYNTTGDNNTGVGINSLSTNTTGYANVAIGYNSLQFNTTGTTNTAVGGNSMQANTTGYQNTASGYLSLWANTTGNWNTAVGKEALAYNTSGSQNTAIGKDALQRNTTGVDNTAVGTAALQINSSGSNNTAVGIASLGQNNGSSYSTAMGFRAAAWSIGPNTVAVGANTLVNNSGTYNVAVGNNALNYTTSGSANVALGHLAGQFNSSGAYNATVGYLAGSYNTNGSFNTYLGAQSAMGMGSGSYNIILGGSAAINKTSGWYNVLIGKDAGVGSGGASYELEIENGGWSSKPLIGGSFSASPNRRVEIGGDLRVRGYYSNAYDLFLGDSSANQAHMRWYSQIGVPPGPQKYLEFNLTGAPSAIVATDTGDVAFGGWPGSAITQHTFYKSGVYKAGASAKTDCPATWWCNGQFWDITLAGLYYSNLSIRSDKRLKKNIKILDESFVKQLLKLEPVQFEWKKDKKTGRELKGIQYGFIAQDVEKVWPDMVSTGDDEMKTKSISMVNLVSPIVKAFKFLHDEVAKNQKMFNVMHNGLEEKVKANSKAIIALEEEVKDLKLENKQLKDRLNRIEKALNIK